ncbi:hypothetical protein COU88_01785, partial [Candidatus Roizmanbacteria bacterium CG10_big_fil_rev_8_21_14_0_10_39_6]
PIMKDQTMKDSATNPAFVDRVEEALINRQATANVAFAFAKERNLLPKVKGCSPKETELMERIARVTEQLDNNTAFRTAQRVNEHLKAVQANLREDKRRNSEYQKTMSEII